MKTATLALLLVVLALPDAAWAQRGRGFHPHGHRTFFVGSFFVGPPMWYAYPPGPYYYAPVFVAGEIPPTIYVEKFEGIPSTEAGEIYCPALDQYYPDAQACPNGWQRVIRAAESAAQRD
jgi:hypothetical protein